MTGNVALAEALGDVEPAAPTLTPDQADRLAALVDASRLRQRDDLKAAIDGGLGNLPRLVRGPVKRLLFR